MKFCFTLMTAFMLLFSLAVNAQSEQDSIILLNGRVFLGSIISDSDSLLTFQEKTKKGETVKSQLPYYRIFSYSQNGTETVIYKENSFRDNFLSVDEARKATLGSYDARQTFKPRFVFWSSLAFGYGASLLDTYLPQSAIDDPNYVGSETSPGLFKRSPTIFPFFVPAVLTVSWSLPSFRVKEHQIIQKHLINDESYYRGYHRISKQKRMLYSLRGSLIGIGMGLVTYAVMK